MKASLKIMQQYSDAKIWEAPAEELVIKIGAQLGAVEETVDYRGKYDGIRIVEIVEAASHPNADKLNIYQVFDGKNKIQVLSNDRNLNVGDKVAWLAPGVIHPETWGTDETFELGTRDIRGETSHGMFSSGKELGLNDDDSCVIKLDTSAKPGTLLADAYNLDDVIVDIENKMFTHRPDCFGQLGVAREIAGIQGLPYLSPRWYDENVKIADKNAGANLTINVDNRIPELVPRYMAIALDNIKIQPSPLWLQSYLTRVGIRPINNIVDITNYIMVLTGQPLHAFDFDKNSGGQNHAKIVIRHPRKSEKLDVLDGRNIEPHEESILICDAHQPVAMGGMIGGANSEIDNDTTRIILECANFDMYNIRRSSMTHGIFTDAVTRFSKGQSVRQCRAVMSLAVQTLIDIAGAQVSSDVVDNYKNPSEESMITIEADFINKRLGGQMTTSAMATILRNVEFVVEEHGGVMHVRAPFWRTDIEIPEDIVEEVGRLVGFDQMPYELPTRTTTAAVVEPMQLLKGQIRKTLASAGANELQTYSFVPAKLLSNVGQNPEVAFSIRNAISPELEHYRLSLTPSLLDKVHGNVKSGEKQFGLFEMNKIHVKGDLGCDNLPREYQTLSFVWTDSNPSTGAPYYRAKRYLQHLLDDLNIDYALEPLVEQPASEVARQVSAPFQLQRAAYVYVGTQRRPAGFVGEYTSQTRKHLKLPDNTAGFELDLEQLIQENTTSKYQPLLKFPATEQDVCVKVSAQTQYASIVDSVHKTLSRDSRLRISITPVDIYQRDNEVDEKQITVRVRLQHHDKTMVTEEVNNMLDDAVEVLTQNFGARRV